MKIVSFLPSATEIIFALGLEKELFAVTFECDYPPEARGKPVIVRPAVDMTGMTQNEIDQTVRERQKSGDGIYRIDEEILRAIQPDIILTQNLCQVCAPSEKDIITVCKSLSSRAQIVDLSPWGLEGIFENIRRIGEICDRKKQAEELVYDLRKRMEKIRQTLKEIASIPRVVFLEWLDPLFSGGHWIPEMVQLAGGRDIFARDGEKSRQIHWTDILDFSPEIIILSPCGINLEKCVSDAKLLLQYPGLDQISAYQNDQVYAVNANDYFARPGPRVIDGLEILAKIFHPDIFEALKTPSDGSKRLIL